MEDKIQAKAEEMALKQYGCELDELSDDQQLTIYDQASLFCAEEAIENVMNRYEDDVIHYGRKKADEMWGR